MKISDNFLGPAIGIGAVTLAIGIFYLCMMIVDNFITINVRIVDSPELQQQRSEAQMAGLLHYCVNPDNMTVRINDKRCRALESYILEHANAIR